MIPRPFTTFLLSCLLFSAGAALPLPEVHARQTKSAELLTIEKYREDSGLRRLDTEGFLPLYWDEAKGTLFLEIPKPGQEMIYATSLPAGVGSNDIGLDRGQRSGERIVRFEKHGRKLLLIQPNLSYRDRSSDPERQRAITESFAQSTLYGFTIVAATGERVLVDATAFAVRDAHGVIQGMQAAGQGAYSVDASRSMVYLPYTRAFPRNTEIEAMLTFTGGNRGRLVSQVSPTSEAVTVRERHSFIALPPPGYTPRRFDPRAGYFSIAYADFGAPLTEPLTQQFIQRHRLAKKDPSARESEPVEPIRYYVDRGAPEKIRNALLEGARWWNQAFQAAGYKNAFVVELMPEGADPMDIRYNTIQWVHRSTRGWSYGDSVTDPRTGEILKANVTLGSLRDRQDYMIIEGLLSPYKQPGSVPAQIEAVVLARIRQLSAHEVGHTLGLAHNYISSTQKRASVMDYPAPWVRLTPTGEMDLSSAYTNEIGAWDKVAIQYGYLHFPEGVNETAKLTELLKTARTSGLTFLSDQDARSPGSSHPQSHLWDNGTDAAAELGRIMAVRRAALKRFGDNTVAFDRPLATIEEPLVPIYLYHRYQTEAAAKMVGGTFYTYALRGDGQEPLRPVPAADQNRAIEAVLSTLKPAELALPASLRTRIPPRSYGSPSTPELFGRYTGLNFDVLSPATTAADMTLSLLLQPERAARLVLQHVQNRALPGLETVLSRLLTATDVHPTDPYEAEVARAVRYQTAERLMDLAGNTQAMPQVRAVTMQTLQQLQQQYAAQASGTSKALSGADKAQAMAIQRSIKRFLENPADRQTPRILPTPPGSPIGDECITPLLRQRAIP